MVGFGKEHISQFDYRLHIPPNLSCFFCLEGLGVCHRLQVCFQVLLFGNLFHHLILDERLGQL